MQIFGEGIPLFTKFWGVRQLIFHEIDFICVLSEDTSEINLSWSNSEFYFNPISNKIDPIKIENV